MSAEPDADRTGPPAPGPPAPVASTSPRGLVVGLVLGLPVIAYGLRGALVDAGDTHPGELGRWIVGAALAGDLLLVPIALAVGVLGRRFLPAWAWRPVRAGLLATGLLALVAWPFVRGYGHSASVPSLLARDYAAGLAIALSVVWAVVAAVLAWQWARRPGERPPAGRAAAAARAEGGAAEGA